MEQSLTCSQTSLSRIMILIRNIISHPIASRKHETKEFRKECLSAPTEEARAVVLRCPHVQASLCIMTVATVPQLPQLLVASTRALTYASDRMFVMTDRGLPCIPANEAKEHTTHV